MGIAFNRRKVIEKIDRIIIFFLYMYAFFACTGIAPSSVAMGFVLLLWIIKNIIDYKNFPRHQWGKIDIAAWLFVLSLIVADVAYGFSHFYEALKYLYLILFYYAIIETVVDLHRVKKLFITSFISLSISLGYGFFQHFQGMRRIEGFISPLNLGLFLAMFLIFLLAYFFSGVEKMQYKIALGALSVIVSVGLILTGTRGAWLAFLLGCIVLGVMYFRKVILVLLVVVLLFSLFAPDMYIDRFKSSFALSGVSSNTHRLNLWQSALEMFRDNPLTGVGTDRFKEEYRENYKKEGTRPFSHAHNNFLNIMAEAGLFGILSFLFLLAVILYFLYTGAEVIPDKRWRIFVISSFVAYVVFIINGLTEFNYSDSESVRYFWFLFALNTVVIRSFRQRTGEIEQ
ncbi:MAG: O-antigen ligase family protein [Halanaerobiaceae bacterium]